MFSGTDEDNTVLDYVAIRLHFTIPQDPIFAVCAQIMD